MKQHVDADAETLLAAAKSGDSGALGALFGRYQNYIQLLATTQIRSKMRVRASSSDIAQDTFLNAHRGFAEFRGTTSGEFVAWLRTILARRIQYLYQQHLHAAVRDVRREVSLDEIAKWVDQSSVRLSNVLVAKDLSPATRLQNQEHGVQLANALASLSPDHREVLMLRSIEGLGFTEVARRMERSHGAVRMLWLRAIEALRDAMGERASG